MSYIKKNKAFFDKIMTMLEAQFGPNNEIVLHDYSNPYENTIVDIRNGYVTGRKIGDCISNFGLEVVKGTIENGDKYNYITYLKPGNVLRSSSMYIYDENNEVAGCLCINTDITETIHLEEFLRKYNNYPTAKTSDFTSDEVLPSNVGDLLEHLINEAQNIVNVSPSKMKRDDKIKFIQHLDYKGAFLISKAGEKICEYLGISKYTLYKYLDSARELTETQNTQTANSNKITVI